MIHEPGTTFRYDLGVKATSRVALLLSAWLTSICPAQGPGGVAGDFPAGTLQVIPVPAKVGSYPPGTVIVGNELRALQGGFRAWFEFQVGEWDLNGDGFPGWPGAVQITIETSGYEGDQADLTPSVVSCATDAECAAAFGESWAKCESSYCKPTYGDRLGESASSFCEDFGSGPCVQADCDTYGGGLTCFAIGEVNWGRTDYDGSMKTFATMILAVQRKVAIQTRADSMEVDAAS